MSLVTHFSWRGIRQNQKVAGNCRIQTRSRYFSSRHNSSRFWVMWLILKATSTLTAWTRWRERMWQRNREDWKANRSSEVHTQPQDRGLGCLVRSALAVDGRRTLLDFSRVIVDDGEILRHSEGERGGGLGLMPRMLFTSRLLNESLGLRSPSGHCKHGPV